MVNLEWGVPHTIVTPEGSFDLNTAGPVLTSGRFPLFLLKPTPYQIIPGALRAVSDNLSQADGSSLQPPFIPGLTASLHLEFWVTASSDGANEPRKDPACDADLREMNQRLMLHLNALRAFSSNPNTLQRLMWTPTGLGDRRMLTAVLLASWPQPEWFGSDGIGVGASFALATPFPYAIDATEIDTDIADGTSEAIANNGNASQSPVVRAYGPSTGFVIENLDTGALVSYDASRPPGHTPLDIPMGHYAEINFFTGSIYLDGDGDDLTAGLDPAATDFFLLAPGSQTIAATGADMIVLSNNAVV